MKVLEINVVCGIKSTGRICTDLASCLMADGNTCLVAYGREYVPEEYSAISWKIGSETSVKNHALISRFFDCAGFGSGNATKKLIKKIQEFDPDIIHLHNLHGYYINIRYLFEYLKKSNKPVVWTLHDCWAFTGHCCHFDLIDCFKWKEDGCHNCALKTSYPKSLLLDRSKNNFREKKQLFTALENVTIVTPSQWLANLVKESYLSKYPVKVINNGIDTDIFKPTPSDFKEKYGLENKKIVLGVSSLWTKDKGLEDFIRLSELLGGNCKIVLVGEVSQSLPENILVIGRTDSREDLAKIYTMADVFVNPTYEDTYPTVNLEAQACGTPVITYKTGGSPESVDLRYGSVVEQGSIDELVREISHDFSRVEVNPLDFDKNQRYKEYTELYKSLVEMEKK